MPLYKLEVPGYEPFWHISPDNDAADETARIILAAIYPGKELFRELLCSQNGEKRG
jgi:hypothetical protein